MSKKKTSSRKSGESTPRKELILERTLELFYRNGYATTGVQEILDSTGLTPPTLYYHFGSKQGLGLASLEAQDRANLELMASLKEKGKTLKGFVRAWSTVIRRSAWRGEFIGCPFANFSRQVPRTGDEGEAELRSKLREIENNQRGFLKDFLRELRDEGMIRANVDIENESRKIMVTYHGAVSMWGFAGDRKYIKSMEHDLMELAENLESESP